MDIRESLCLTGIPDKRRRTALSAYLTDQSKHANGQCQQLAKCTNVATLLRTHHANKHQPQENRGDDTEYHSSFGFIFSSWIHCATFDFLEVRLTHAPTASTVDWVPLGLARP